MCLYTKQICPLRARKDIVCYKRFELVQPWSSDPTSNLMRTTVMGTLVRIPTTDEPTIMVAHPENCIEKIRIGYLLPISVRKRNTTDARFQIYGGMIHAYTRLEYSKGPWPLVIFKCIIPKDTLYYKGTSGDICAKKMLVVEQVK